ncbi:MAG: peptidogalycan biosysnthesis protein, partial [Paraperlucidibaca sp.]
MPQLHTLASLAEVTASAWDALFDGTQPFLTHAFLSSLEDSGSVSASTGWQPAHQVLKDDNGALLAAAPSYIKSHSRGEYVFDTGWADACCRAGIPYYP